MHYIGQFDIYASNDINESKLQYSEKLGAFDALCSVDWQRGKDFEDATVLLQKSLGPETTPEYKALQQRLTVESTNAACQRRFADARVKDDATRFGVFTMKRAVSNFHYHRLRTSCSVGLRNWCNQTVADRHKLVLMKQRAVVTGLKTNHGAVEAALIANHKTIEAALIEDRDRILSQHKKLTLKFAYRTQVPQRTPLFCVCILC